MLDKTILIMILFLMMVSQGTATVVNETVDDFRISFDSGYDINAIARAWDIQDFEDFPAFNDTTDDIFVDKMHCVAALNINNLSDDSSDDESNVGTFVLIFILNKQVNTTNVEKNISESSNKSYMRVYDRTIDGRKGLYVLEGDGPDDPDMGRIGYYWLNEDDDGMATELVMIITLGGESSESSIKVLNTVHVEKKLE